MSGLFTGWPGDFTDFAHRFTVEAGYRVRLIRFFSQLVLLISNNENTASSYLPRGDGVVHFQAGQAGLEPTTIRFGDESSTN